MTNDKKLRVSEMVLVMAIAFLPSIIQSIYSFIFNVKIIIPDDINMYFLVAISQEFIAISALVYVLSRQGRRIDDIVAPFRFKDILHIIGLYVLSNVAYYLLDLALRSLSHDLHFASSNIEFLQKNITFFYVLFILINPVFEELIVRGFLITEIVSITGKGGLAVTLSVLIQVSYHLYQGLIPAVMYSTIFLIFSLYFLKFKRIMPIIIAHAIYDISAMLYLGSL